MNHITYSFDAANFFHSFGESTEPISQKLQSAFIKFAGNNNVLSGQLTISKDGDTYNIDQAGDWKTVSKPSIEAVVNKVIADHSQS